MNFICGTDEWKSPTGTDITKFCCVRLCEVFAWMDERKVFFRATYLLLFFLIFFFYSGCLDVSVLKLFLFIMESMNKILVVLYFIIFLSSDDCELYITTCMLLFGNLSIRSSSALILIQENLVLFYP